MGKDLAVVLGMNSSSSITQYKSGNSYPLFETLIHIADCFKVDLESLVFKDLAIKDDTSINKALETKENASSPDLLPALAQWAEDIEKRMQKLELENQALKAQVNASKNSATNSKEEE